MEDLDEHLLLTGIEISCWKDQLKQAVSQLQFTNNSINFFKKPYLELLKSYFIPYSTPLQGFTETTLTPLQASTILLRVDQRRAVSDPPLPPITKDQILHGKLATLLKEGDYNLATMVNSRFFYTIYFEKYLFLCLAKSFLIELNNVLLLSISFIYCV